MENEAKGRGNPVLLLTLYYGPRTCHNPQNWVTHSRDLCGHNAIRLDALEGSNPALRQTEKESCSHSFSMENEPKKEGEPRFALKRIAWSQNMPEPPKLSHTDYRPVRSQWYMAWRTGRFKGPSALARSRVDLPFISMGGWAKWVGKCPLLCTSQNGPRTCHNPQN